MKNILLIDKEAGWTSFDVVAKIRNITGEKKVGHAGTLDPFATGLLIILVGKAATKRQAEFMKMDKEYEATLELGKVSTTGDLEGIITPYSHSGLDPESREHTKRKEQPDSCFRRNDIQEVLKKFIGEIEQVPPTYSAIKVKGKRAYELARKGIEPELKPRKVKIYDIKILNYTWPFLTIRVKCSSGTYIRSLAKDIGEALGTGAYLKELQRTRIGKFSVKDAKSIAELNQKLKTKDQTHR